MKGREAASEGDRVQTEDSATTGDKAEMGGSAGNGDIKRESSVA